MYVLCVVRLLSISRVDSLNERYGLVVQRQCCTKSCSFADMQLSSALSRPKQIRLPPCRLLTEPQHPALVRIAYLKTMPNSPSPARAMIGAYPPSRSPCKPRTPRNGSPSRHPGSSAQRVVVTTSTGLQVVTTAPSRSSSNGPNTMQGVFMSIVNGLEEGRRTLNEGVNGQLRRPSAPAPEEPARGRALQQQQAPKRR